MRLAALSTASLGVILMMLLATTGCFRQSERTRSGASTPDEAYELFVKAFENQEYEVAVALIDEQSVLRMGGELAGRRLRSFNESKNSGRYEVPVSAVEEFNSMLAELGLTPETLASESDAAIASRVPDKKKMVASILRLMFKSGLRYKPGMAELEIEGDAAHAEITLVVFGAERRETMGFKRTDNAWSLDPLSKRPQNASSKMKILIESILVYDLDRRKWPERLEDLADYVGGTEKLNELLLDSSGNPWVRYVKPGKPSQYLTNPSEIGVLFELEGDDIKPNGYVAFVDGKVSKNKNVTGNGK